MALSKYGDITSIQQEYANREFLTVFQPETVTQRFGKSDSLPKKNTRTMTWKKYDNLTVTTAPVAEGVTPESTQLTQSTVSVVLQQYIYVLELTDIVKDTHEDPVMMMMVKRIGQAMAQTIEKVTISVLKSTTTVYRAGGAATRTAVNATVSRGLFRQVVRGFHRSLAKPFTEIIAPSAKVSTAGVESAFFAMCHTDLDSDIRNMTGFKHVIEYSSVEKRVAGEVGAVENIRILTTTNFEPWLEAGTVNSGQSTFLTDGAVGTGSPDVYPIIVVAKEGYGVVRLQGKGAVETYVLNPGQARGGDPAAQRGSVANKVMYGAVILNSDWVARVEACATGSL